MNQNRLKINTSKKELVYFVSAKMLPKCDLNPAMVMADSVEKSGFIRYLGA